MLFSSHWAALVYKYLHLAAGCSCTGITCDLWLWLVPELWINITLARVQFQKYFQKSATVSVTSNLAMHGALNVDEKKLIAQFGWKSRDECFEPN